MSFARKTRSLSAAWNLNGNEWGPCACRSGPGWLPEFLLIGVFLCRRGSFPSLLTRRSSLIHAGGDESAVRHEMKPARFPFEESRPIARGQCTAPAVELGTDRGALLFGDILMECGNLRGQRWRSLIGWFFPSNVSPGELGFLKVRFIDFYKVSIAQNVGAVFFFRLMEGLLDR